MLTIYRLHGTRCSGNRCRYDRSYRRCHCPIHLDGSVGGQEVREGLGTGNWELASKRIAEAERLGCWDEPAAMRAAIGKSLEEACEAFLKELQNGRRLGPSALQKYRRLTKQLREFCVGRKIFTLPAITVDVAPPSPSSPQGSRVLSPSSKTATTFFRTFGGPRSTGQQAVSGARFPRGEQTSLSLPQQTLTGPLRIARIRRT